MSAPQTNITTQERRHRGPLIGMAFAVAVGVGALLFWLFDEVGTAGQPRDTNSSSAPQTEAPPAD